MNTNTLKIKPLLALFVFSILIIILSLPLNSFAAELIHTIQVASSISEKDTLKYYEDIQQVLSEKELEYLRIEKVGKYYTVRLGKHKDINSIKKFLQSIKSRIPTAIIMKSYIKEERIIKSYTGTMLVGEQAGREKTLPEPEAEKAEPVITEKKPVTVTGTKLMEEQVERERTLPEPEAEKAESEITEKKPVIVEDPGIEKGKITDKAKEAPAITAPVKITEAQEAVKDQKHKPAIHEEKLTVNKPGAESIVSGWFLTLSALIAILIVLIYIRFFKPNHSIQTGSFLSETDALNNYESILQMLSERELEHLRVAKAGNYYSVRLGNYKSEDEANFLLPTLQPKFPAAVIIKARIDKEKILKHYAVEPDDVPYVDVSKAAGDASSVPEAIETEWSDTAGVNDKKEPSKAERGSNEKIHKKSERAPLTIKACKEAVMKSPGSAEAHDNLGIAFSKAGMHKYAIESHKKAIKLNPNIADPYYNLGIACSNLVMLKEAIKAYKKAIKIKPDFAEAHFSLGNSCTWSGLYDEAIESYKSAINLKPHYPEAYNKLGVAYGKAGLYGEAIEAHKEAIEQKPAFATAYNTLGEICSEAGKLEEAIEAYKDAIKIKPNYAKACLNLGMAYSKAGKTEEAVEAYKNAIDINPKLAEAHNNLGIAYSKLDMIEDAIDAHKQAIKIKPNYEDARRNLETAYNKSEA
jgi:tetratricopeptide (TPR) repeat protein